jgi:hypothetical protein
VRALKKIGRKILPFAADSYDMFAVTFARFNIGRMMAQRVSVDAVKKQARRRIDSPLRGRLLRQNSHDSFAQTCGAKSLCGCREKPDKAH